MHANHQTPTACFIIIGNEILSGRTQDVNLAYLAHILGSLGISLKEVRVIPDVERAIILAVNSLRSEFDYVFTSGGIGPTHDDITSAAVAKAFGVKLFRNPQAVRLLEDHYRGTAHELNEARLKMADIPEGASLIDNPVSRAPGFKIDNVYVLAGVPKIFQAMVDGLKSALKGGPPILSQTVSCNLPEGKIASGLAAIQSRYRGVEIGSYPYFRAGMFGTSLVLRSIDQIALSKAATEVAELVHVLEGSVGVLDD